MSNAPRQDDTLYTGEPGPEDVTAEVRLPPPATSTQELDGPQVLSGRYEILALLGGGAMGSVYRARDRELSEDVALKVLRRELLDSPAMVERFRNEVKLARRVTHHNVARTFDIGEHEGEKFLTMELVEGEPLSHRIHREGRLGVSAVVEIMTGLCAGLAAAHEAGVVHRDLKPDNVLLAPDGRVVITDFGIARGVFGAGAHRTQGAILGTPIYMAPEQVEATEIDARTDIYALGCMLYEMLTGQVPWDGDSPYSVALARLLRPPPDARKAGVPDGAAAIVLCCMARRPEDRYGTISEVGRALATLTQPAMQVVHLSAMATAPALERRTAPATRTLAILPLRNGSAPEDAYLAAGLTEDLTDILSMTKGLRVRPRGAVLALSPDGEGDPQVLGQKLGVDAVLEGSLRRLGDRMRVQLRLIGTSDGFQLWAQRFERPAADILAVSEEAAQAVAGALTIEAPAAVTRGPADPRVVDLYLRARHVYHMPTVSSTLRAVDLLEEAIAIAPDDPAVLTLYALSRARLWFAGGEGSEQRARTAAARALEAAPGRGESFLAMGIVRYQEGDLPESVRLLRQAIAISPALGDAHELYGRILLEIGPLDQAIAVLTTALALDPDLIRVNIDIARAHALRGEKAEAQRLITKMKTGADSTFGWITQGRLAMWFRDEDLAAECLAQRHLLDLPIVIFGAELVLHGRSDKDPEAIFGAYLTPHASERARSFFLQIRTEQTCVIHDLDGAFRALEAAVAVGLSDLLWLRLCPILSEVRSDARFAAIEAVVAHRAAQIRAAL